MTSTRITRRLLLAAVPLAACAPGGDDPAETAPSAAPATAGAAPHALARLTSADHEAEPLAGELACVFTADGGTLLTMRGNAADPEGRAEGLARTGDVRLRGRSSETGGFDALLDGTRFAADGLAIAVEMTSNTPLDGGESPPYPARLIARWADGTERTYQGTWTCGP